MGREISIQGRALNTQENKWETIYDKYICGRDDCTNYIANLIYNKIESQEEPTAGTDEDWREYYSISFDITTYEEKVKLDEFISNIQDYADKDRREINRVKALCEDLRIARQHAATLEEFDKFTAAFDDADGWLEHEDWSRAENIIAYIEEAEKALKYANNIVYEKDQDKKIRIVLSE